MIASNEVEYPTNYRDYNLKEIKDKDKQDNKTKTL